MTITKTARGAILASAILAGVLGISATPAQAAPGIRNIGPNSSNSVGVSCTQRYLNAVAGAGLVDDGNFGPATYNAVVNFQKFFSLSADGIVGPRTGDMLGYVVDAKYGAGNWRAYCWYHVPTTS